MDFGKGEMVEPAAVGRPTKVTEQPPATCASILKLQKAEVKHSVRLAQTSSLCRSSHNSFMT